MRILLILIIIISGYSLLKPSSGDSSPNTSNLWGNYSPIVKERIDKAVQEKDCLQLQKEFDAAYKNSNNQRHRTGTSNSKLMNFLDYKMTQLKCYK